MRFLMFLAVAAMAGFAGCGGDLADDSIHGTNDDGTSGGGTAGGGGGGSRGASDGGSGGGADASRVTDGAAPGFDSGTMDAGSAAGSAVYSLAAQSATGAPAPNATGITYDGQELWIVAPTGNPQPYVLERFPVGSLTVDRTFTLPSLYSTLATYAEGLTWDGSHLVIAIAGDTNAIVKVDPSNGSVLSSVSGPTGYGPSDLDFDGTDLWVSTGDGDGYRLNASDGVDEHISLTLSSSRDHGIAYRSGELFVGGVFGGLEVYDPTTGAEIGAATKSDGSDFDSTEIGPSVFVNDDLVMLSSLGITVYKTIKQP